MKISFITQFNQPSYGGVYFAATAQIKQFIKYNSDFEVDVFNIRAKPPIYIRWLKNIHVNRNFYPQESTFNGLNCKNIYLTISIFEYITLKLSSSYEVDLNNMSKEI